ncbi:MAG: hypothetical protein R3B71_00340 [Candidatus Gracilibacteria bacterium]
MDDAHKNHQSRKLGRAVLMFLGLASLFMSLIVLNELFRGVIAIGGYCAEGGPYEIAVPCPDNTLMLAPIGIIGLMLGILLYLVFRLRKGPNWIMALWPIAFLGSAWTFLQAGLNPSPNSESTWPLFFMAAMFGFFGAAPLWFIRRDLPKIFKDETGYEGSWIESYNFLQILHFIAAAAGVALGFSIIHLVS